MNADSWKQDPRLKQIDPEKLQYITDFAGKLSSIPKEQLPTALAALQMDAAQKNIRFSNQETDLLVSILTSGMSPGEKKRLEALRLLAKKMAARSS
ncbi:MAG: hypothetical protein Q4C73_03705 [Eubacteriales bacterium]|nr:hypothetical protein [Eubacteriales bacterium]